MAGVSHAAVGHVNINGRHLQLSLWLVRECGGHFWRRGVVADIVEGPLSVFVAQNKLNLALAGAEERIGWVPIAAAELVGCRCSCNVDPLVLSHSHSLSPNEYFNNAPPRPAPAANCSKSLELLLLSWKMACRMVGEMHASLFSWTWVVPLIGISAKITLAHPLAGSKCAQTALWQGKYVFNAINLSCVGADAADIAATNSG